MCRIDTILKCDKILVIQAGTIAESGPPQELLLNDGEFKKLANRHGTTNATVFTE